VEKEESREEKDVEGVMVDLEAAAADVDAAANAVESSSSNKMFSGGTARGDTVLGGKIY